MKSLHLFSAIKWQWCLHSSLPKVLQLMHDLVMYMKCVPLSVPGGLLGKKAWVGVPLIEAGGSKKWVTYSTN